MTDSLSVVVIQSTNLANWHEMNLSKALTEFGLNMLCCRYNFPTLEHP